MTVTATRPLDRADRWRRSPAPAISCARGTTARFHTTDVNRAIAQLVAILNAQGIEITELHVQKATLEDVFLELTSADADAREAAVMDAFLHQFRISLRLHFRNRMALIYSYLFPTIFLIAFWVLYRYDRVPLARHMGELLTVTALGGACFGLPTTMVSERERGVWRRYRLAPVRTGIAAGEHGRRALRAAGGGRAAAGRAGDGVGMPLPSHPLDLWIAFTFVAFALLGLGLVIATLADNVPAVQALGQCIFLPMLIIGGVAVQLSSLPEWAQHVSAFFPGRYAVEAMQSSVTGAGPAASCGSACSRCFLIGAGRIRRRHQDVPLGRPAAFRAAWRQGLDRASRWRPGRRSACSPNPAAASDRSRSFAEYRRRAQPDDDRRTAPAPVTPSPSAPAPSTSTPSTVPAAPAPTRSSRRQ